MKGKLFSCLVLMFLSISMVAQKVPVSGTVSDQTGPVIGASVIEKGTTNGTMTDNDGHFTLTVSKGAVIEISSIGYKTQEITVGAQTNFTVTLSEDNEFLDEVVVVGYGSMKKSDLAGASVSMKESDLKGSIISSLDQSLQGRAAGVTAVTTSGAPGSSSSIRVRGQATINANAEPLYVIDGVIVQGGGNTGADFGLGDALGNGKVSTISPLSTINPADIVSMEILKDASATAIYGAQGANGVVLITTKHGKSGEAKFSYDGMVAMSRQAVRLNMMNLREYAQYYNEMIEEGDIYETNPYYATPSLLGKGTNWQDEIFRTAWQHQHQLSAQGGSDKVQYYVSGSYMDQQGTIIGSNFNRFSVRTNLDAQLKKWLKLGVNATYAITNDNLKLADSNQGLIYYSLTTIPDIPVYDVNGNYSSTIREGYTSPNPVALAMMDEILLKRKKLSGNIYAELTPIKHITWRTELGFDMGESDANRYKPMVDLGGWVRSQNSISYQKNSNYFWQLKNYLTYANQWGKHSVTAMVGQECWESRWNYLSGSNTDLPSDEVHNVALATGTPSISSGFGSYAWGAAITRMPSALGMGFRPSNIPNTSIRWESQEQYNVGLDLGFFNGRLNLTVDAYYKKSDDMLMSMQLPSYMGTQGNGSSKLQAPKGNYGSIENKGLEITLDAHPVQLKNFSWDSNFQISFNKNKLLSLSDTENATLVGYGQWGDVVCVSEIGKPLYNFYGYKVEGVYKDLDDIQNSAKPAKYPSDGVFSRGNTVWVGDIKYKDVDENGIIDERDRTDLGSPLPKFTFGWTNTFRYKNLDLSIFLNGSYGNKVMNYNSLTLTHMNSTWTNQLQGVVSKRARLEPIDPTIVYADGSKWFDHIDNVRVKNPGTKIPHTSINDPNDNDRISDRYVEDGSFLRIKNITLGYTFPKALLNKAKIENLRVYVNIQNLYTFTKYTGYDPEVGASTQDSSGLTYGLDNGRYPSPAMYSFGLNITF